MAKVTPPQGTSGIIVEQRGGGSRFRMFAGARSLVEAHVEPGMAWLRVFGRGVLLKTGSASTVNIDSDRPQYKIGPVVIEPLITTGFSQATCAVNALFWVLACRYAQDLVFFYGRPVAELSVKQVADWITTAGHTAELGKLMVERSSSGMAAQAPVAQDVQSYQVKQ